MIQRPDLCISKCLRFFRVYVLFSKVAHFLVISIAYKSHVVCFWFFKLFFSLLFVADVYLFQLFSKTIRYWMALFPQFRILNICIFLDFDAFFLVGMYNKKHTQFRRTNTRARALFICVNNKQTNTRIHIYAHTRVYNIQEWNKVKQIRIDCTLSINQFKVESFDFLDYLELRSELHVFERIEYQSEFCTM